MSVNHQRGSARPAWLPYFDGRSLDVPQQDTKTLDPREELGLIWKLVDNNACDFEKASRRWEICWGHLTN